MRKQIIESILIFLFGGLIMGYLMCPTCFTEFNMMISAVSYSGLLWLSLWKGNELIARTTEKYVSWLETPGKRFLIGIGLMLVYTVLASSLLAYIFYILVFQSEFNSAILDNIFNTVLSSIGITSLIMLIMFSINFFKSWRQAAINEEKFRKEHVISQYEALKNQVNPHFLFNSLNALSTLVYEDQDKAVQFINRLSDVYRYVLDTKDKEVISLKDEMEFVNAYIQLQQARHEENLKVTVQIEDSTGFVLPLSIQMLVENAIKHNVVSSDHPLHIRITRTDDQIIVENQVKLKSKVNSSNQGLINIQSRYNMLSNRKVLIEKTEESFKVTLPVLKME